MKPIYFFELKKIEPFTKILQHRRNNLKNDALEMFHNVTKMLNENYFQKLPSQVKNCLFYHLVTLQEDFKIF